jgi:hypothetical protein
MNPFSKFRSIVPQVEMNPVNQANTEVSFKSQTIQDFNQEESSWAKQDLNEFKLNIPLEEPQAEISLREFEQVIHPILIRLNFHLSRNPP